MSTTTTGDIETCTNPPGLMQRRFPFGRWNNTSTNFKLFPVITQCTDISGNVTRKQATNLFRNTTYQMSKKELYRYLTTNRAYLYR